MNNCYYFKLYNFNDGLLNNFVDATYIIHLVNNGRIDDIKKKYIILIQLIYYILFIIKDIKNVQKINMLYHQFKI